MAFDRELLARLFDFLPLGIVAVNEAGLVETWNPAAEAMLGWRAADVLGGPLPLDLLSREIGQVSELPASRQDGTPVYLEVRTLPWRGAGTLVVFSAVSHSRPAGHFQELLEAAPDAIVEASRDGRIILMNHATHKLFGYAREELIGQPVELLIPTELRTGHVDRRRQYWQSPTTRPMGNGLKLEGQRQDGSRFPVEISLSPLKFEGESRVLAIIRDVSEQRKAAGELELRNQEVEKANSLKSEFLSGMSHELRTPLHTIIGFAELLAEQIEGPLNPKQERFVAHIHRDSQHLLALINDVLDLSKIESGRLELQPQVFPLAPAIDETVSSILPRAEAKSIRVETSVSGPAELYADRLRFRQILYNLLSNAVKFTPANGRIAVRVTQMDSCIAIAIADTGIGIPAQQHEAVFDKFYQVGQRQAGGQEGTGLGLAITRRLVEAHGGTITLDSGVGKGSTFTFTIPLVDA